MSISSIDAPVDSNYNFSCSKKKFRQWYVAQYINKLTLYLQNLAAFQTFSHCLFLVRLALGGRRLGYYGDVTGIVPRRMRRQIFSVWLTARCFGGLCQCWIY